ncbi:MAG TPA: M64 family metallopeptidase, partial [Chitinophagaceae bacterium]|nr:M64 family metallopeptidase [Chitinophagaceae bacterium]
KEVDGSYQFNDITGTNRCEFELKSGDDAIVQIDRDAGTMTPKAPGKILVQVRAVDPEMDEGLIIHDLIIRVWVHNKLDTWWFGNDTLSVFIDGEREHSKPSIYALFDKGTALETIGDISGHGYVFMEINPPIAVMGTVHTDRIKGVSEGDTMITGQLGGKTQSFPLKVIDLVNPTTLIAKELDGWVDRAVPIRHKPNMLFIAEGYQTEEEFQEDYLAIITRLFGSARHSPFNILVDDFNIWTSFNASKDNAIATVCQIRKADADNYTNFPGDYSYDETPSEPTALYTMKELVLLVGLPEKEDAAIADNNILRTRWSTIPGYNAQKLINSDNLVNNWKKMVPETGFVQVTDTYYGFGAGNRWGEKSSRKVPITQLVSSLEKKEFNERLNDWYFPNVGNNVSFQPTLDHRRWAPEVYIQQNTAGALWVNYLIRNHIMKFKDNKPGSNEPEVGKVWGGRPVTALDGSKREVSSFGLVCFLINSRGSGRAANKVGFFIGLFTGIGNVFSKDLIRITTDGSGAKTIQFKSGFPIEKNHEELATVTAHEYGHSFGLGDEYEDFAGNGTRTSFTRYDNLTHLENIKSDAGDNPSTSPARIDPAKIKWKALPRVTKAIPIVETGAITDANTVKVKVHSDHLDYFKDLKTKGDTVYLRRLITYLFSQPNKKILRSNAQRSIEKDIYTKLIVSENPVALAGEKTIIVTLARTSDSQPSSLLVTLPSPGPPDTTDEDVKGDRDTIDDNLVPAGSFIYVPKKNDDGDVLSVMEKEVFSYMANTPYSGGDKLGRALTENFNNETAQKTDQPPDSEHMTDHPPDIPNFKPPCSKDYTLVGAYEGGGRYTGQVYRPTGACKMRNSSGKDREGEFCFVCKYIIVARVNPAKLALLDKQFPEPKQRKWIARYFQTLSDVVNSGRTGGII